MHGLEYILNNEPPLVATVTSNNFVCTPGKEMVVSVNSTNGLIPYSRMVCKSLVEKNRSWGSQQAQVQIRILEVTDNKSIRVVCARYTGTSVCRAGSRLQTPNAKNVWAYAATDWVAGMIYAKVESNLLDRANWFLSNRVGNPSAPRKGFRAFPIVIMNH
mmetsp:Transcript_28711/g.91629  ORF Transcript_28711/g.91629 Transcript_28711/m.91629 type:complete len:160 (+) Transcript_28711:1212-1691(+)